VTGFRERAHAANKDDATRLVAPAGNKSEAAHVAEKDRHGLELAFGADLATGPSARRRRGTY
jgi:hypothetical protein